MSSILDHHFYFEKNCITELCDVVLWPTYTVLGGRSYNWYEPNKVVKNRIDTFDIDCRCFGVFLKMLLIPVVLILLPLTFVAICIKACDPEEADLRCFFEESDYGYQLLVERVEGITNKTIDLYESVGLEGSESPS